VPHITGDIVNSKSEAGLIPADCDSKSLVAKKNVGYTLRYNLDPNGTAAVPGTSSAPNPEFWELTYKNDKGFVLIEGGIVPILVIILGYVARTALRAVFFNSLYRPPEPP
jgi:hypothetical protein